MSLRWNLVALIFIAVLVLPFIISNWGYAQGFDRSLVTFYIMGSSQCPHCTSQLNFFAHNYPNNVYFCDIASSQACLNQAAAWINFSGFPDAIPQTFVLYNRTYLLGIVIGEVTNQTFWEGILSAGINQTGFPIYYGTQLLGYVNATPTQQKLIIDNFLFPSTTTTTAPTTNTSSYPVQKGSSFLATLVSLAFSDAINICIITVYSLLLVSIAASKSKKSAALSGIAFSIGIFTGYLALGLGLLQLISLAGGIPVIAVKYILLIYGVFLVLYAGYSYITNSRECKICKENENAGKAGVTKNIERWVAKNPVFHFFLGVGFSILLIPCSAGPYIVFVAVLSSMQGIAKILYLLVYDIIFVAPLLVVLEIIVLTSKKIPEQKLATARRIVLVVAGIALIILSLFLYS